MSGAARAWQKGFFRLRERAGAAVCSPLRKAWWRLQGARFGPRTLVGSLRVTWPHQVSIGADCILEPGISFKFDGFWLPGPAIRVGDRVFIGAGCEFNIRKGITIGPGCAIASKCQFVDHDHGFALGLARDAEPGVEREITLGSHVWLGAGAIILKGVSIGEGAIVGAGAVVTKPVPAYEIWGGVPARKIGVRH